ncbi:Desmethyl-deoxy-podophyllotoxin synthase [Linum perenne]
MDLRLETEQLLFLALITILTSTLILLNLRSKSTNKDRNPLPPGPRKLPLIGNLHHLATSSLPHRRLNELAKQYGPLMHLQLGEIPTVVISSPEVAKQFMKTHDLNFCTRPLSPASAIIFYGGRDIGFAPYGDYWKHMRKICAVDLLSAKRVRSFVPVIEEEIDNLRRLIFRSDGQVVNMSRMVKSLGNSFTCRAAFGMSREQEDCFLPIIEQMVKELGGFSVVDLFPSSKLLRCVTGTETRLQKLHEDTDSILESLIADHLARRRSAAVLGFPFSNVEIKAVLTDIILAGSDTWTVLVEWALSELIKNPSVMNKAQEEVRQAFDEKGKIEESKLGELHYLQLVIKETFRLHPPGPLAVPREARETVMIDGYRVPAKTRRFINSPVDFKGRNFELIPFGAGRRICPGMLYAVTVINFVLANLLYHFDWNLPHGMKPEDVDLTERFGFEVRLKNDLVLIPKPYHVESKTM